MNKLIGSMLLIVCMGCNSEKQQVVETQADSMAMLPTTEYPITKPIHMIEFHEDPYELSLQMARVDIDVYELIVGMELFNGAFFVSPNAKRDFSGKFTVYLEDSNTLFPIAKLKESPPSVEEFDPHPFVNGTVNWVRSNTTYTQRLQRDSEANFQVQGEIRFTIEPRCTFERIPITIKYEAGELLVEVMKC